MKCSRCSAEIPKQAQFCMRCGTPVTQMAANATMMPGTPAAVSTAPRSNTKPFYFAIGLLAVLVLALGAYVVKGQLTQKPGNTAPAALVQAPGETHNNNLVQAPADTQPSNIVQSPTEGPPADVIDYLAFLKRVEASKQELIRKQIGSALGMMAQAKSLSGSIDEDHYNNTFGDIGKGLNYSAEDWNQLTQTFQQRTPPASCQELHDRYYDHLGKIQAMIVSINDALAKVQSDPSGALNALTSMQGKASADADSAIMAADDALADVCNKFHLRKDFDIKGDPSSASIFR